MNSFGLLVIVILVMAAATVWGYYIDLQRSNRRNAYLRSTNFRLRREIQELEQRVEFLLDELDCATGQISHSTRTDAPVLSLKRRNH